ncbi:DoxX family protein [Rugosimonospora africana]|uniref:DoxX-like family protein n=1 Tax=Rugosimonospora africana TaxID=556532 RepID=A0A8J3VT82_9ACTN|nr:DoxX family protein [Rugosimonospora africana]GIH17233.1 hypothetical protein Raf01_54050 [Rugosimonospora africana]
MHLWSAGLSIVLAAASLAGGTAKLAGARAMRADARRFGFRFATYRFIGGLELAAAAGLVAGLFVGPLGMAAAGGLVALMAGATLVHARVKDPAVKTLSPIAVGVLAAVTGTLLALVNT